MGLRDEAEELAMAIELGFALVDEAVDWADRHIVAVDQPPYELIEVSSAGRSHPLDVAHLLRAIPGTVDIFATCRRVFARMLSALNDGRVTPEAVARALDFMQLDGRMPDADAQSEMSRLNDAFDLAHEGTYGTSEEVSRELREFLEHYIDGGA